MPRAEWKHVATETRRREQVEGGVERAIPHLVAAYGQTMSYPAFDDDMKLTPIAGVRAHVEEAYKALTGRKIGEVLEEEELRK